MYKPNPDYYNEMYEHHKEIAEKIQSYDPNGALYELETADLFKKMGEEKSNSKE